MRERLIQLIGDLPFAEYENYNSEEWAEHFADHLIENGVVVLPCKVGQTVYIVDKRLNVWWQGEVDCVYCDKNSFEYGILFDNDEYGVYNEEDVFLIKEEAERALKGGAE